MSIYYEDEVALEEPNRMVTRTKNKRNRRCLKASISDLTFGTIFPPCNNLMKNVPSDERNVRFKFGLVKRKSFKFYYCDR